MQTDWEDVLNRKPDFICLAWVGVRKEKVQKENIKKRPGFEKFSIEDHQIFIFEEELYCRPKPRLLEGLEKLFQFIH